MKVERTCPICGDVYEADTNRLKHGRQTTCSRSCSYELRGRKQRKERVTLTCSTCGKEFERLPSKIKSKHEGVYCSRSCHYKGRTLGYTKRIVDGGYDVSPEGREAQREAAKKARKTRLEKGNYGHTEATKEKLRAKTAEAIAAGKFDRVSEIEDVVAEEMSALGIDFVRQKGLRSAETGRYVACLDFFIPDKKVAVEVNGTFWHADPRFYDRSDLTSAQERTLDRYSRKESILEARGINLIEVWEHDIKEDPQEAVENALGAVVG